MDVGGPRPSRPLRWRLVRRRAGSRRSATSLELRNACLLGATIPPIDYSSFHLASGFLVRCQRP